MQEPGAADRRADDDAKITATACETPAAHETALATAGSTLPASTEAPPISAGPRSTSPIRPLIPSERPPPEPPASADDRVFQVGDTFHQLDIVRFLAAGYSGQVYECRHRVSGQRCAIKVMHLADRQNARKLERSLAEAEGTYGLKHANVVEVLDIGCEPTGMTWILMEFLDGCTLADLLTRQGRLSPLFALWVVTEAAWGLDAAHENQIIHRDVKPENLFFTRLHEVKVIDFSIAKVVPYEMRTTEPNVRLGTAAYMSPEHLFGSEADARFDVYALGLVLWELLVGDHPFRDALHDQRRLTLCQFNAYPAPLVERLGLPPYLDALIRRATAKNPDDRFLTMSDFAQALLSTAARLRDDVAAGRLHLDARPGEPSIPESGRARSVYRPPVTGPALEVPGQVPSAKVLVAASPRPVGPRGTAPLCVEAVREAVQAPWYADSRHGGPSPPRTVKTPRKPAVVTELFAPSPAQTEPPLFTDATRPGWATRTTSPVLRQPRASSTPPSQLPPLDGASLTPPRPRRLPRMTSTVLTLVSSALVSGAVARWTSPLPDPSALPGAPPAQHPANTAATTDLPLPVATHPASLEDLADLPARLDVLDLPDTLAPLHEPAPRDPAPAPITPASAPTPSPTPTSPRHRVTPAASSAPRPPSPRGSESSPSPTRLPTTRPPTSRPTAQPRSPAPAAMPTPTPPTAEPRPPPSPAPSKRPERPF
ncbi:serine/threonine-protein kinase [Chondromyces crocatus]|uniref:Protein kinase domain-containing protein n=1 Tax=Chondromyces crocatus TaxID=52 RepID=A0A0K1EAH9_CHOCO|nr:serine/threonine-protein kinase [Chondromyces crocatus]AKT37880.1 uncharacterized protein CMC5_020230 [Chondromyces crocatus]